MSNIIEKPAVGLFTLGPSPDPRKITVTTPSMKAVEFTNLHSVQTGEDGSLILSQQVADNMFPVEFFPAGTWTHVTAEPPTVESIERFREKATAFAREQSALHQKVASLGAPQGAQTAGSTRGLLNTPYRTN